MLNGNVLITGGAGFLGRGIMARAQRENWPAKFYVLSRDEEKQVQAKRRFPDARFILGDVCDYERLRMVCHGMDTVIHAAALKFIPEGEFNADECVRVNIDGSRTVRDAARAAGVRRVVGVSTDKAAQPINIYGMTKAVMERLFVEAAQSGDTTFTACRYGNVLGSTGSVVPVMMKQYRDAGSVTITDPNMTRYWMSIDHAIDTILHAHEAGAGTVTIPTPQAAGMLELVNAVLEYLHVPGSHVQAIGRRPGEKLHETLVTEYEAMRLRWADDYYELLPPGNDDYNLLPRAFDSDSAPRIDVETLVGMIESSSLV